ncbi:hypothetical protein SteCoe_35173 [Stentor coeruleus]|uniref:Uncharacterized protein n=1 Tax=Stentor coeruleus TaxID=5963 RepID=A0A1R2ASW8_9CILI|nr:hypothetical protein SteCoe_35173 [Stentor coeruleus]
MDGIAERRFQTLKKRLDSLHYCETLGFESSPLVEKLLNDLLKTTEDLQQLKTINSEANNKIKSLNDSLIPLQNEVASLMKKNNELHLYLMTTKEEIDSKDTFWRASIRKLEVENSDLNFLIRKSKDDFSKFESQNSELRLRLDGLMTKTYTTQKPINDGKDVYLGKVQTYHLPKGLKNSVFEGFSKPDTVWANELRAADERTKKILEELENCAKEKSTFEDEVRRLKVLLENRNSEITRLTSMIGTEFKPELITNKYKENMNNVNIEQLNDRIDLLNSENIKLERELAQARIWQERFYEIEKENLSIVESMVELRNQNQNLQLKIGMVKKGGKGFVSTGENEKLKSLITELQSKNKGLEKDLQKTIEECNRNDIYKNAYNEDKISYTEAISKIDNERSQLNEKVIELEGILSQAKSDLTGATEKEKMYQGQIENLKREIEAIQQTYSKINKDNLNTREETYQLKSRISTLESQANIMKAELESNNFEAERQKRLKKNVDDSLEETKKELLRIRNETDSLSIQKQKLQVLLDSSQKEAKLLQDENSHLIKLREKDKQALIECDDRIRDLNNQLSASMHSNRILQKENQNLLDELSEKLEEHRKNTMTKSSYEQELAELRPIKLKYQQIVEESSTLRNSFLNKDTTQIKMQWQIDKLEESSRSKDFTISEQERTIEKLKEDINKF